MGKLGGVYRGLLWAAATGRLAGVIGAPPCRNSSDALLLLKQLRVTFVAKAAIIRRDEFPIFIIIERRKFFETIKDNFDQGWESPSCNLVVGFGGDAFGRSGRGHGLQF